MGEKFSSCIKESQYEENTIFCVGYRGSQLDKSYFDLPGKSPCFDRFKTPFYKIPSQIWEKLTKDQNTIFIAENI